jgi:hypothetical protein
MRTFTTDFKWISTADRLDGGTLPSDYQWSWGITTSWRTLEPILLWYDQWSSTSKVATRFRAPAPTRCWCDIVRPFLRTRMNHFFQNRYNLLLRDISYNPTMSCPELSKSEQTQDTSLSERLGKLTLERKQDSRYRLCSLIVVGM